MKNANLYTVVLAMALSAVGMIALSPKPAAAQSCCERASQPPAAESKAQPDLLPTCPVSGNKLGEMGKPFVFTYQDREVKLCCGGCKKDFDKDPAKYLEKIVAAEKTAKN